MKIDFVYALDDSCHVKLFCKGHIGPPQSVASCFQEYYKRNFGKEVKISLDDVKHIYWRNVPAPSDNNLGADRQLIESKKGAGAFRVTVVDKYLPM